MSSIYDTEERVEQGLGNIKEENGYQQWDMEASRGLMCMFISPIFLSKLLLEFWVYTNKKKRHTKDIKDFGACRLSIHNSHTK